MINLHFHKAEPVPFYVDTVFLSIDAANVIKYYW